MQQYMIGEKDVKAYQTTYEHTLRNFAAADPAVMGVNSGIRFDAASGVFTVPSMGKELSVKYPGGEILFAGSTDMPLWPWRLITLNHLARADNADFAGSYITYRETEGGHLFYSAFHRMSIQPLIDNFSNVPPGEIIAAGEALGGISKPGADVCLTFPFLPRFPITVKIWLPDEEMTGSANILFDSSANHYLHTEDIAVASSTVTDFLIREHRLLFHRIDSASRFNL